MKEELRRKVSEANKKKFQSLIANVQRNTKMLGKLGIFTVSIPHR